MFKTTPIHSTIFIYSHFDPHSSLPQNPTNIQIPLHQHPTKLSKTANFPTQKATFSKPENGKNVHFKKFPMIYVHGWKKLYLQKSTANLLPSLPPSPFCRRGHAWRDEGEKKD
jgi:hypothetical protein